MKFIVIFLLIFSTLQADRDGGPYLGLGIGVSKVNTDGLYDALVRDTSTGLTFYAGAYINKYLSVEASYVSFDSWHLDNGFETPDGKEIGAGAIAVSTLAHYAFFDDTLDFYAKFGLADMSFNVAYDDGFGMLYGGGMAYRFDETFSVKLAYDMYRFDYDNTNDAVADHRMRLEYLYTGFEMQF